MNKTVLLELGFEVVDCFPALLMGFEKVGDFFGGVDFEFATEKVTC